MGRAPVLALLLGVAAAAPGLAQNVVAPDRSGDTVTSTGHVVASVAQLLVASRRCGIGDPAEWLRVVDAIDRRYWFCAERSPALAAAASLQFEAELERAEAGGSSKAVGSLALQRWLPRRTRQFDALDASTRCLGLRLKMALAPASASDQEKAEYARATSLPVPDVSWQDVMWARRLATLGNDQAWIAASCDKFWPDEPAAGKR